MIGTPVSTQYGSLPYGLTPYTPIDNQYVLDANEVALVKEHVASYNATIKSVAAAKGLAIFDAYTFLENVNTYGYYGDGLGLTSKFVTGGIFSLDGIHLTPRGYSIVANQFIDAINSKYGSNIPEANIADYDTLPFP